VQKICSAFNVPETTPEGTLTDAKNKWKGIDVIAAKKRVKGTYTYYDYDLAYAPSQCAPSKGGGGEAGRGEKVGKREGTARAASYILSSFFAHSARHSGW
jgi:hypothetical protein